jgi:hypothetical protein
MTYTYLKNVGLAAILSISAGFAQAQQPPPMSPAELKALSPRPATAGPQVGGGAANTKNVGASFATGWNLYYCTASETLWDGTSSTVWAFNTDSTFFFWTSAGTQLSTNGEALINACNTGHLYWIFITTTSGNWTATYNPH